MIQEACLKLFPVTSHLGGELHMPPEGIPNKATCHEIGDPFYITLLSMRKRVLSNGVDEALALGAVGAREN